MTNNGLLLSEAEFYFTFKKRNSYIFIEKEFIVDDVNEPYRAIISDLVITAGILAGGNQIIESFEELEILRRTKNVVDVNLFFIHQHGRTDYNKFMHLNGPAIISHLQRLAP